MIEPKQINILTTTNYMTCLVMTELEMQFGYDRTRDAV